VKEKVINDVLDRVRTAVLDRIRELIIQKSSVDGAYKDLYDLLLDYPFRKGKSLRPALCISTARAAGGMAQQALTSSAALEMFHNAALIHDDCEDLSEFRRGKDTIHNMIGMSRAINLGDATQVLSLSFLLENLNIIGVAKSMYVIHEIENMARQSVEGQALELDWIANDVFDLTDDDYFRMCAKKSCWYTFIAPCRIGYMVGTPHWKTELMEEHVGRLTEFGMNIGIAFQIQDDLLNLIGSIEKYGKEIGGDIYEGKRTIMLNHVIATSKKTGRIRQIISKPRSRKKERDIAFILQEMNRCGSIDYGRKLAERYSARAQKLLDEMQFLKETPLQKEEQWKTSYTDRRFIQALVNYVVSRNL
jgi:geranylgeranyl diphosphate synthase, type II